jgi:hypothetical protein
MWLYLNSVSNCAEQNITSYCQIVPCPLCYDGNYTFKISPHLSNNNASVATLRLDGYTRGLSTLWEKYWPPKAVLWCTKSPEVDGTGPPHLGSVVYSRATNSPLILKLLGEGGVRTTSAVLSMNPNFTQSLILILRDGLLSVRANKINISEKLSTVCIPLIERSQ